MGSIAWLVKAALLALLAEGQAVPYAKEIASLQSQDGMTRGAALTKLREAGPAA